jgi:hypothetical protein
MPQAGQNGKLIATWHDTQGDTMGNNKVARYAVTSTNGGTNWSGVTRISNIPVGGTGTIPWTLTDHWKDYEGAAPSASNGVFLAAWADNRAGGATQIWSTSVTP